MQATIAKCAAVIGTLSGGALVVAQTAPVPDGFQSWPVTAMLAFITLTCLAIVTFMIKSLFKTIAASTEAQTKLAVEFGETNTRLNEMAQKHGETNQNLSNLVTQLENRPCILGDKK